MPRTTSPEFPVCLLLFTELDGQYYRITLRVQKLEAGRRIRNGIDTWIDDLVIVGQGDEHQRRIYSWCVEYRDVSFVGARRAERMHQTFKRIERGLARMSERRGEVATFPEYVGRICEVLGIETIVRKIGGNSSSFDENEYLLMSASGGVHHLRALEREWVDRLQQLDDVRAASQAAGG